MDEGISIWLELYLKGLFVENVILDTHLQLLYTLRVLGAIKPSLKIYVVGIHALFSSFSKWKFIFFLSNCSKYLNVFFYNLYPYPFHNLYNLLHLLK